MSRLLIFNPEHDYALAHAGAYYIPPLSVRNLTSHLWMLPQIWGDKKDLILTPDNKFVTCCDISSEVQEEPLSLVSLIEPWGWDMALRHRLLSLGICEELLPADEDIKLLREISHRRISIIFNKRLGTDLIPCEFNDLGNAMEFALSHPDCYFKLPWSSGGRGVVATRELSSRQISEWVSGGIKKQGSVIGEVGVERSIDFASLWEVKNNRVFFEGMSVSSSDGRGKYDGNFYGPQEQMIKYIYAKAQNFTMDIIDCQKEIIAELIAPCYSGKLGIDMMGDIKGKIYPCVEMNIRRTMGHVAFDFHKLPEEKIKKLSLNPFLPLIPLAAS